MKKTIGVLAAIFLAACDGSGSNPGGVTGEPNDTMATATAIPADASVSASIDSSSDLDYYVITIPAGGRNLRIQTFDSSGTTCNSIDPYTDVYSSTGSWIGGDDDSGPNYCSDLTLTLAAGTYYIEVGFAGLSSTPFSYVLDLTTSALVVSSSESEPNSTIGTADGPYSADARVSGAISPAGDMDYYAVQNPSASSVTVSLATFTGAGVCSTSVDTYMRVLSSGGSQLASDDDSGINYCSAITYTIPAYTTVYVEVTDLWDSVISYYELDINFL